MTLVLAETVAPGLIVFPMAGLFVGIIVTHMTALRSADVPESRRRLRMATDGLLLLITFLCAYGLAIQGVEHARGFVLVWLSVIGLTGVVVALAVADGINGVRLHMGARRRLRAQHGLSAPHVGSLVSLRPAETRDGADDPVTR